MIKTVLLDLDDTILDFKMSERVALTKTLNELSIEPTEEIIKKYSKYNISQWKRLELGEISKVQDGRMKSADINYCFKGIFVSEVVGFEKPNVEFFNKVFSQIENFNADEAVIIGDSLSSDIKGGKNAKIKTVWFNPNGLECDDIVPDFQISSLDEIKPLLATL